jgi:hypothetical protein
MHLGLGKAFTRLMTAGSPPGLSEVEEFRFLCVMFQERGLSVYMLLIGWNCACIHADPFLLLIPSSV